MHATVKFGRGRRWTGAAPRRAHGTQTQGSESTGPMHDFQRNYGTGWEGSKPSSSGNAPTAGAFSGERRGMGRRTRTAVRPPANWRSPSRVELARPERASMGLIGWSEGRPRATARNPLPNILDLTSPERDYNVKSSRLLTELKPHAGIL